VFGRKPRVAADGIYELEWSMLVDCVTAVASRRRGALRETTSRYLDRPYNSVRLGTYLVERRV
jgi:hypothetical protein